MLTEWKQQQNSILLYVKHFAKISLQDYTCHLAHASTRCVLVFGKACHGTNIAYLNMRHNLEDYLTLNNALDRTRLSRETDNR